MSRDVIELKISDLSQFAKSLRGQLNDPPSHVETLAMIARAAGYRNYQHLRARHAPTPPVDAKRVERALGCFDGNGKMMRWPAKTWLQELCLWVIWAQLPPRRSLTEREISGYINALTVFQDAAQIRRGLIEYRLFSRDSQGSAYVRIEKKAPQEVKEIIHKVISAGGRNRMSGR